METLWYGLLAVMIAGYVIFDGFDLGAGILHLFVAKNPAERDQVVRSVGPVWDGNEVWLIAGGGTLFFAFPVLYARSFSGFYLPLMMVLWLLVLRGLGIELRHYFKETLWLQFWDAAFALSSLLLALFFGAALGNVVRGVSLDENGVFFAPLWTNFRVGADTGVLDWFTILVGLTAVLSLAYHGALWLNDRTDGEVQRRSRCIAKGLWIIVLGAAVLTSVAAFWIQPVVLTSWTERPWGATFPALSLIMLVASAFYCRRGASRKAFLCSAGYLLALLLTAAIGLYPYVLPARNLQFSLTAQSTATSQASLTIGLYWWIPGLCLALAYMAYNYSKLPKTVSVDESS